MKNPIEFTEARIQQDSWSWYNNKYCLKFHKPRRLIFSIPNENQMALIATGLYPGAADLIVFHHPLPPIFFETKTPTGVQSPKQKEFESHVTDLGYEYYLYRSLEEFQELIAKIDSRL